MRLGLRRRSHRAPDARALHHLPEPASSLRSRRPTRESLRVKAQTPLGPTHAVRLAPRRRLTARSAEAKAFLVITAENLGDGAFTTQIVGLSLSGLKDMKKNGIQHVAEPAEKQRAIVNDCLENASRAIVNRLAGKYDPFMRTKGRFNRSSGLWLRDCARFQLPDTPLFGSHPDRAHVRDDKPSTWIFKRRREKQCDLALAEANLRYGQLCNARLAFHKPGKVPLAQIGTLQVYAALTVTPLLAS